MICLIKFVSLFLLQVYAIHFAVAATNITADQTALLALKAHITYDPHNILANWSDTAPVCSWLGVSCDIRQLRVAKLNISNMDLNGSIPSQVGNLSFLAFLSIRNNNFHGRLPVELTQLTRLTFLDLGFNNFTGVLPPYLGSFNKLETFLLDYNNFIGNFALLSSNMTALERINISHNRLTNFQSSSIFNLSSLKILDLSFNSLHGELPVDIFNQLSELQEIHLSENQISGSIPNSLFKSSQLRILSLSRNSFAGSIPTEIGNLTMLRKLFLDHNNFNSQIPEEIGYLTKLENLSISNNQIIGSTPSGLGNCTLLEEINLSENNLTGEIPATLFNISSLKSISMLANHFSGGLPLIMGHFSSSLVELRLGNNALDGVIPSSISNASNLIFLDLSDNSFTGFIPITLGSLRYLQGLNIANNRLTSDSSTPVPNFLSALIHCRQLRKLELSGNPLNITFPSFGNFSISLEEFGAANCNIRGRISRDIGNFTNLIALRLKNNELTGTIPSTIGRMGQLQGLFLQSNKLQGTMVHHFCHLENLAYLSVGGNELVGSIPECLSNLTSLRSLNLSSNKLNSTIPLSFWTLEDILDINMSSNSLSGIIPLSITNLRVVEVIDLSSNQLSGEIPSSIGELKSLTHLSLAKNVFQGPIPRSLGHSKGLEVLDLSYNNLSGVIPEYLESLLYLKFFNVSVNRLEGEIPIQGPFSNFSAESYMMNKALCGPPQLLVRPCKTGAPRIAFLLKVMIPLVLSMLLGYYVFLWLGCWKRNKVATAPPPTLGYYVFLWLGCWKRNKAATAPPQANKVAIAPPQAIITINNLALSENRRYTYLELQQATDWFNESNLLGSGHFASVYRGTLKDGMEVAIKVFNVEKESSVRSFDVECEVLLRRIHHTNLVKTICISNSSKFKALVMENMANGSLDKWLHTHNYHLDIRQRFVIMLHTARAMQYLHDRCIIHCDIKPSNILLDEDMVAHVSDFSIAKFVDSRNFAIQSTGMCTIGYAAPEYGTNGIVSKWTDVYSFGILLMETFTGIKPTNDTFDGEMTLRRWVLEALTEEVIDPSLLLHTEGLNDDTMRCLGSILNLATVCSRKSPKERLPMSRVVQELVAVWNSLPETQNPLRAFT